VKFGPVAVANAAGAILAHSSRTGEGVIRKGTRLTEQHVAELASAGVREVVVARLDPNDVHEDEAAATVAGRSAGAGVRVDRPFTGRVNLFAETAGVVRIDRAAVDSLNRIDPAITLATVPDYATVTAGQMVATAKIIPFAVARAALDSVPNSPAVSVAPFRARAVGLVATTLPSLKPSVMDKTRRLLEGRLAASGSWLLGEVRVAHETAAVAAALKAQAADGAGILVAFGASAVADAEDVIPAAIEAAGGEVLRLGMPVDPGNLLVLGRIGAIPVLGAPGCARSPKENGFDWVLNRLLADLPVTSGDIAALGVGGLLTEIPIRPQPRTAHPPRIAAIVLAAGSSRRMGEINKLVATVDGKPLVRIAADAAIGAELEPVIVVTGHERDRVRAALAGLAVVTVHNPDHRGGLSTSLRAGLARVPEDADGVLVLLGDMPEIDAAAVRRIAAAFVPGKIVAATHAGERGNPVLWPRKYLPELNGVTGDTGGRAVIDAHRESVVEVELGRSAGLDLDTPEALAAAGGRAG
jgi:molybdenum cofactor cytidylyltransferase